ncbi:MAG: chemotaxis protein CheW [Burkholderiales bacterium]
MPGGAPEMNGLSQTAAITAAAIVVDCWNKVGVHGDGSCPKLQQHIHCRNCPTYTAAALALLDRDLPAAYLDEWTTHFSRESRIEESDSESIVVFRIGDEWLGLPAAVFSEVVDVRTIHSLPHRRNGILLGLTNVRGELLICVSLEKLLGIVKETKTKKLQQRAAYQRLVVIHDKDSRIVFPADEVHGIHKLHPSELRDVPATVAKATATYARAMLPWEDRAIGCLDEQLLFYSLQRSLA